VVERHHHSSLVTLFWSDSFTAGEIRLRGSPAHHVRARRVQRGESVRLLDGLGRVGTGKLLVIAKDDVTITVDRVDEVPKPVALELIVPVADKERMLMAAEKCVELQVTAWRPVYFARSRSVTPRGEGDKFRDKVRARMQSALEQSGGAWLPEIHEETEASDAMKDVSRTWRRLILDASGRALPELVSNGPTVMAVGPEGGIERHELDAAVEGGWETASLGPTTLRFETAVIAGAAVIRATQLFFRSR
jgi:16S rRNA (uracil1498-N3)-methyltransferase